MKLEDLNIHDIGNTIQLAGAIWADGERVYLVPLPDALTDEQQKKLAEVYSMDTKTTLLDGEWMSSEKPVVVLDMDRDDWARFIRQTDLLEVEVLAATGDNKKLAKAVIRKSTRQIAQGVSWQVYKRDGYHCRYCGCEGVPMTVDHVVTWEDGGPSIPANLVTACRKCNKVRGNTKYEAWLRHPYYRKVSGNLPIVIVERNEALVGTLDSIPRMVHKPKKR
jgi:hypothetical protein